MRYTYYTEIGTGVSANAFLLLSHILKFLLQHRPRPTDLPIALLALTHLVILVISGFMATDMFEFWGVLDDITCKAIVYVYRVLRGLSLCITCLLSVLQAITLSPRSSWLAKFKHTHSGHSLGSLLLLWVFYMAVSSHHIYTIMATPNGTSDNPLFLSEFCSAWPMSYFLRQIFSMLVTLREVPLIGLMALSSGYMVTLLCRHKRQSRHLHGTSLSPRASPEHRATLSILLLMGLFTVMSILDCIFSSSRVIWSTNPTFYRVYIIVAHSYATISPLVFICTEKRLVTLLKSIWIFNSQGMGKLPR